MPNLKSRIEKLERYKSTGSRILICYVNQDSIEEDTQAFMASVDPSPTSRDLIIQRVRFA